MECPPGVHSMFDFCPGNCTEEEDELEEKEQAAREAELDWLAEQFKSTLGSSEPTEE